MPVLGTKELLRWGCPPATNSSPPTPDVDALVGQGSRLLMYVQDDLGNDFEIWCVPTTAGYHYQYQVSYPDGKVEEISTCIYSAGLNDVELVYSGPMSETTAPNGSPVINVGRILVVEHSNTEGQGNAFQGIVPKPGGANFHIVHDYRNRYRYRLNTKVGTGVISTDILAQGSPRVDRILRAEGMKMESHESYQAALASDTDFRRLDDPSAIPPCQNCNGAGVDADGPSIGYIGIEEKDRSGAILLDPGLSGCSAELVAKGVRLEVPARPGRTVATLAVSRGLFPHRGKGLTVRTSLGRGIKPTVRETDSMVALEFRLDGRAHQLELLDRKPRVVRAL
jgi:hypothetical protein